MKYSIGIDVIDVKDLEKRLKRTKNLLNRVFTEHEIEYCKKRGIEHLASRFAAKEAFAKASNLKSMSWKDVEVKNSESGKPYFNISKKVTKRLKAKSIDLSISNLKNMAVAIVIINR